jgi:hypothetical protein
MEPVTTIEAFRLLQNPDKVQDMLAAYYETLGFHVVKATNSHASEIKPAQAAMLPADKKVY